ncbi:hypothetical protein [Rhodococcus sp. MTM3W5.2]|uniref:hypothetical protein n=1 Tax=Rhodococcus sp. MTM3W5.2 TaxID=1805827 RepID=UPI00097C5650|nr:hypothetical protein [Rhodococcus sp. MTM3W5.2]
MKRITKRGALVAVAGIVFTGLTVHPGATADPAGCVLVGTVGTPEIGADPSTAGLEAFSPATAALPDQIHFRTSTETFNRRWSFTARDGGIYVKEAAAQGGWRSMPLPGCLAGKVVGVSADDDEVLAVDRDGRFYTLDHALRAPKDWNWSTRYGTPLWTGPGNTLPRARSTGPGRFCPRTKTMSGATPWATTTPWAWPRSPTSSHSPTAAPAFGTWTPGSRSITATKSACPPVAASARSPSPPAARPLSW